MRLFVGISIPAEIGERLWALTGGVKGARWMPPETYHLTLRFLGDAGRPQAEELDAMLQPFLALFSPEAKEAAKNLRETIKQGELPPPIDAEVDRFYREAAQARREIGKP